MALFDFSNLKGMFASPSPDGGWSSGTTTSTPGAFFSRDVNGGIAGVTPGGMQGIGKAMQGAAAQMPGGYKAPQGAFGQTPTAPSDPNAAPDQTLAFHDLIAAWRRHMQPAPTQGQ